MTLVGEGAIISGNSFNLGRCDSEVQATVSYARMSKCLCVYIGLQLISSY